MKENKEQLRSAEEILADVMDRHGIYLSMYSAERRCALEAAELYASQFKSSPLPAEGEKNNP